MLWRNLKRWRAAVVLGSTVTALFAGDFAAPAEGPVAFRRDRLSLDTETMSSLSKQLVILAEGVGTETAEDRLTVARMLALSTALDPGNAKARSLISTLERAPDHTLAVTGEQVGKSQGRVWDVLDWLEKPEAGHEANALAACLLDVLAISDAKNPRSLALHHAPERGAWKGWIPPLAAYETKAPEVTPDPVAAVPEPTKEGILLENAEVSTVLWISSKKPPTAKSWHLGSAPLEMTATMAPAKNADRAPFSLAIGPNANSPVTAPLVAPLLVALEKLHGKLPAGGHVTISSDALTEALLSRKRLSISAAVGVLASSAISGREPHAVILGLVDETGAFKLPTGFWAQLQALGPGKGGKLILPTAAAEYLPSMLALEKPEIFFDYEILLAGNFKELVDLSAKEPPEAIAKASALFREIRAKLAGQTLRQYVANPFIRRRLADLAQEAPYHFSAKMLAIQGAGDRPAFISRLVLCAELKRVVEPVEALSTAASLTGGQVAPEGMGDLFESCKTQVDRLFRYTDKPDRDLIDRAQTMIATIHALDRATRSRGESYEVQMAVSAAYAAMTRSYTALVQSLAAETGDTDPVLPP